MRVTMDRTLYALVAKIDPEDEGLWLPLIFHLEDTAAVMDYLLDHWLPERYWESLGLEREAFRLLADLAALLHDAGKGIPLFQGNITDRRPELRERLRSVGLDPELPPGTLDIRIPHGTAGAELLRLEGYGDNLAAIVGAHHGRPESEMDVMDPLYELSPKSFGWRERGDRDTAWGAAQKRLIRWAAERGGLGAPGAVPACSMAAEMALTGLTVMADWIASNTAYFPLIPLEDPPQNYPPERRKRAFQKLRLPSPWEVSEAWRTGDFFPERFGFPANGIQKRVEEAAARMEAPGVLILEAPMGQGKTEAALAAAEILMNRFRLSGAAFFLPSQATANAMFTRMARWARRQPDAGRVAAELAHGQAEFNEEFQALATGGAQVQQGEAEADPLMVHSFFQGRKTKLLANLVVGTVDQLLMAALRQKHVMLRQLGLTGKVVVIDECHAYDAYMNTYLDRVLDWLGAYRVPVILLSATLPGKRRAELLRSYLGEDLRRPRLVGPEFETERAYPLLCWTEGSKIHRDPIPMDGSGRSVTIQRMEEEQALAEAVQALERGCVGIIVNTVRRAQALRTLLRERCPKATVLMDHSRFLAPDRLDREREILARAGKDSTPEIRKGVLVIGTQVLEQSLDLDFDLLITDLCPMDLLLQRIGRLHRHARLRPDGLAAARCLVLGALRELDDGGRAVYGDYLLLRTRDLLPDRIRLPEDISPLTQETYAETPCPPASGEEYQKAWEDYRREEKERRRKAGNYCLDRPAREEGLDIVGLLDDTPGFTDPQARAAVRDGSVSIEALVLQMAESGFVTLLSGDGKGARYRMDTQPSGEEARTIAAQRLRLPAHFSRRHLADDVIGELEEQTRRLPLWTGSPMLAGELFLLLSPDGMATLAGKTLRYDPEMGLTEEGPHGRESV